MCTATIIHGHNIDRFVTNDVNLDFCTYER